MLPVMIGCVVIVVVFILWGTGAYNRLVRLRNEVKNAFAQIDVQLKRRYDLIPNLVETARKYVEHERDTLEAVISARNQANKAREAVHGDPTAASSLSSFAALASAEGVLGTALGRLMAVVEAYPELKADASLRELSEELTTTENRIGFARQAYNDSVLELNYRAQRFPDLLVAGLFGFKTMEMLESTENEEERKAVKVKFD